MLFACSANFNVTGRDVGRRVIQTAKILIIQISFIVIMQHIAQGKAYAKCWNETKYIYSNN